MTGSTDWPDCGDPAVALLRRSTSGSIAPISDWPHYGDHQVARLRRSRIGTIAPINNSYADVLRKSAQNLGLNSEDQENLGKWAFVRNRLAHRYLNFRWQAIQDFSLKRDLVVRVLSELLKKEEETQ